MLVLRSMSRDRQSLPSVPLDTSPVGTSGVAPLCMPDTPALEQQQRPMPSPQHTPQVPPAAPRPGNEHTQSPTLHPLQQPGTLTQQPPHESTQTICAGLHPSGSLSGALPPSNMPPGGQGHVLRLRGLPFSATAQQIIEFFGDRHSVLGGTQVGFLASPMSICSCICRVPVSRQ